MPQAARTAALAAVVFTLGVAVEVALGLFRTAPRADAGFGFHAPVVRRPGSQGK